MRKIVLYILVINLSFLSSCSESDMTYNGPYLNVGVIGDPELIEFDNIHYHDMNSHEQGPLHLLIVEGKPDELEIEDYKEWYHNEFKDLPYPVVFVEINIENSAAFGYLLDGNKNVDYYFVPGFPLEDEEDYKEIYVEIYNVVNEFLYSPEI